MNKTLIAAAVAGIVLLASNAQAQTVPEGYQLQQVLMMSRHNLRAPPSVITGLKVGSIVPIFSW